MYSNWESADRNQTDTKRFENVAADSAADCFPAWDLTLPSYWDEQRDKHCKNAQRQQVTRYIGLKKC